MNTFSKFTNLYPLSKTLRFELRPIGSTLQHMQAHGVIATDQARAEDYKRAKKIIDEFHKCFIAHVLSAFHFEVEPEDSTPSLATFYKAYLQPNKTEAESQAFVKLQDDLRKQVAKTFEKHDTYKRLFKKELIKEDLLDFVTTDEDRNCVETFKDFTTYFIGFHENRKNIYTEEAQSTAIAYRLVHDNLPKFIDNMQVFAKVADSPVAEHFETLYEALKADGHLRVSTLAEVFTLGYYNYTLTQAQIELYNTIIGGKTEENGQKIQGLNEYINLFNQQQPKENRLPKLKPLFKQILSDREQLSWLPEEFKTDNEVLEAIHQVYQDFEAHVFAPLKHLLQGIGGYDLHKIYLSNNLTDISQKLFGDWSTIQRAFEKRFEQEQPQGKKKAEAYEKAKERYLKGLKSVSIGYINESLELILPDAPSIERYYATLGASPNDTTSDVFAQITTAYQAVAPILTQPYPEDKKLVQDKATVSEIKALLDALKALQLFIKPLLGTGQEANKDERFYGEFVMLWECIDQLTPLYNKVRNYVTRKPYSQEKIKINFNNSTLLNGWDVNKEEDNTSVLLRKDGQYYLAIMNRAHNKVFKGVLPSEGECYEKMDYKLLPGANKMLPKVFFSQKGIAKFAPSSALLTNYKAGTHKKGDNFSLSDCHTLIDFFKTSIKKHEDWSKFDFEFSETQTYQDISGFYREVEHQGYRITFRQVSDDYINTLVEEGKIYLFQIYNKDFSPHSKGTPNMHTLYWKALFDEQNLADVVYKLNGEAEVFYRKASLVNKRPTHPANEPIDNKNSKNPKKQSTFTYDLIKDKRYTEDKFFFHVPITMNFKGTTAGSINALANAHMRATPDLHVIGIDRGERHLLYLTVIDGKGRIKEQYSLNEIINHHQGNTYHTDYHALLEQRDEARHKERQSWQTIENIKELKQGYLSQVVHRIAQLMVRYNAIVVLEDLNIGFKRGRQKVESNVYQQFEKSLIDKLNYLVDKSLPTDAVGGVLHAYQLTNKFESFQKMGKQNGFLLYMPAWNTSKMDPVTGFVNLFDTRFVNVAKAQEFFGKFTAITYNAEKDWFKWAFDYKHFTHKAQDTQTQWTLCTWGTRIRTFRNAAKNASWDSEEIDLTPAFKALFERYGIALDQSLQTSIVAQSSKEFHESLLHLLRLTLQMRNSITGTTIDYLVSPVADASGKFYDSRTCNADLPQNADANGAYNIARKGLWAINQIRQATTDSVKLALSNKEWLQFAQTKPYLDE